MTAYEECIRACEAICRENKPRVSRIIMRREMFNKMRLEMHGVCAYQAAGPYRGIGGMMLYAPGGYVDIFTSDDIPWTWVAMNENGEPVEHGDRVAP
jgi:hypothetical protein